MPQISSQVVVQDVAPADDGQRLDNWLLARLKGVPRSHVYRLIRSGQVRVNGGRAKPASRVASGDKVRIPPVRTGERSDASVPEGLRRQLRAAVIYRDDGLIGLNKPPGLAAHAGTGVDVGLIEAARVEFGEDWQLAHRLDRETSGCLLLVRGRELQNEFQALLQDGAVGKHYQALVHGRWSGEHSVIESQLERSHVDGEQGVRSGEGGKYARSDFTLIERYRGQTLMAVRIHTGRMHQIRVQAADHGHPVCGDRKYGDRELDRALRPHGLRGLCLHAARLEVEIAGRELCLSAPRPPGFEKLLRELPA